MRPLLFVIWFVVIFAFAYFFTGVTVVLLTPGSPQAKYEAAHAFRDTYAICFAIGALVVTSLGWSVGLLPGAKGKRVRRR